MKQHLPFPNSLLGSEAKRDQKLLIFLSYKASLGLPYAITLSASQPKHSFYTKLTVAASSKAEILKSLSFCRKNCIIDTF